jgi:hypothetical protein
MAEIESQTEFERLWRLKYAELYADQIFVDEFGTGMDESVLLEDADLMGLSEEEIDKQCQDMFGDPPIKFNQRPGEPVDELIAQYIDEMNITIPIVWIKDNFYLIGSQTLICEIKRNCLLIRIGGGYESFQEYVIKNDRYFQRSLIIYMIKSGENLDYIVDCLI